MNCLLARIDKLKGQNSFLLQVISSISADTDNYINEVIHSQVSHDLKTYNSPIHWHISCWSIQESLLDQESQKLLEQQQLERNVNQMRHIIKELFAEKEHLEKELDEVEVSCIKEKFIIWMFLHHHDDDNIISSVLWY